MNNKTLTIAVVAIVVVAALAVVIVNMGNDGNKSDKVTIEAANLVYGNANNDAYVDEDDLKFVQDIVDGKTTWDKEANPFADAEKDGEINSADVDKIKMIINNESGKVWYQNYLGEAQQVNYPLEGKNIAVMYWQQAEAAAILGVWDNVKVANAYVTQIKADQYDLSHVVEVESTSTNYWVDATFTTFADQNINVIMVTPNTGNYSAIKAGYLDSHPDCDVILLSHVGSNAIPSILTMGILFNAEDRAEAYAEYCYGTIEKVKERLDGQTLRNVIVTMTYPKGTTAARVCSGTSLEGSVNILSYISNVYTADDVNAYGQATRDQLWFTEDAQDKYDTIFMNYSSIDWFTCESQDQFNEYFDNVSSYFSGTNAYKNHGMVAMPYVCGGYSGFGMMMYAAWMLYPTLFTQEEAQDSLQYWFDNFCCDKNNKLASGELSAETAFIYYTGKNYTTYTQLEA